MFWGIAGPADKELPAAAAMARVDDLFDGEFFKAVRGDNRARLCELSTRKQGVVIGDMSFQFRGMVDRESVRFDV